MKTAITAIIKFCNRHRKLLLLTGTVIIVGAAILPHLAMAQTPAPPVINADQNKMYNGILGAAQGIMNFLNAVLWPVLLLPSTAWLKKALTRA